MILSPELYKKVEWAADYSNLYSVVRGVLYNYKKKKLLEFL